MIGKVAQRGVKAWRLAARWQSTVSQDAIRGLKSGQKLHGYTVQQIAEVPELCLTAVALEHDKTGAEHLHVAREDNNNTFSVAFRTTPMDSTGVPHILEHTTLCGSQKFPVRDPFFKMLNRSLATFMNAMTASDWTVYPFSTQNKQDFENLLSIYLDAVFYPQLRELDFRQEGWRLEHANLEDRSSPLIFKGVVYNEMKGVFSSSQNIFSEAAQNKLLPSHTYGVVSGGDPDYIPDLTWDHLKQFQASHYHPSNSRFLTYGNFPLEDHLKYIGENYLAHFDRIDPQTSVPAERRWTQPREAHVTCQPDPMAPDPNKQTTVAVNFLLSDITDIYESSTLSIISSLLVEGETSPFYQTLLEANIGSDYAPVVGYNGYTKEGSFSVGLQGIHSDDIDKVKKIIEETIDKVIREGFDPTRIEAVLHRIELSLKHQTTNFGLGICMTTASSWNHGGDPIKSLKINDYLTYLKQQLKDNPQFLQKKVKQYLKDNSHRLTLTMSPDDAYEEKRQKKEQEKLQSCIDKLTDVDRERIYKLGLELHEMQMKTEDLSCLPTLKVDQIDRNIQKEVTDKVYLKDVEVQCCEQPTNEVAYVRLVSNLSAVPQELLVYVPLFTNVITKMGAGIYDFKELSLQMELLTGGMSASTHVSTNPTTLNAFEQGVLFSSYCLERNMDEMLSLWTEIFDRYDVKDVNRLTTLIRMTAAEMSSGLSQSGHAYAMNYSASSLTPAGKMKEIFSGMSQVSVMKKIAESESQNKMIEHLVEIAHHLLNRNNLRMAINATPAFMPKAVNSVEKFLGTLPGSPKAKKFPKMIQDDGFKAHSQKTHIELPFSVNYMSKCVQTVPYMHEDSARLSVLAKLLSWKYLHREIREKGGAYGGGAMFGSGGVFSFFSYRDPNSMRTLSVFEDASNWAADGNFTNQDVEEAKLSVFQQTDKPVPPGSAGMNIFLSDCTDEMRQTVRDRLFAVTRDELVDVANRYIKPGQQTESVSFIGPANEQVSGDSQWKILKE